MVGDSINLNIDLLETSINTNLFDTFTTVQPFGSQELPLYDAQPQLSGVFILKGMRICTVELFQLISCSEVMFNF